MSTKLADRVREGRDRGGAFLLRQRRSDGGFGPPEKGVTDYYKVPLAFSVCGESAAANRLLHWIRQHGLLPNGDFGPRPPEANGYYYLYYNTWVVVGAQRQGHFDLAQRGMDFLMTFWDRDSGGFYSSPTEREPTTLQDLWVVSGAGQAALYTGRLETAQGVAHWMRNLLEAQPEFPARMFSVYSRADGLITQPDPNDEVRYVLDVAIAKDQYFFHPGIAAGFLVLLYRATNDPSWLEIAEVYMRPAEIACDFLFRSPRAGKVGWAASLLWRHTAKPKYRKMAERVGNNLLAAQQPDGCWDPTAPFCNDFTAEFVVWLDEIYQTLGN